MTKCCCLAGLHVFNSLTKHSNVGLGMLRNLWTGTECIRRAGKCPGACQRADSFEFTALEDGLAAGRLLDYGDLTVSFGDSLQSGGDLDLAGYRPWCGLGFGLPTGFAFCRFGRFRESGIDLAGSKADCLEIHRPCLRMGGSGCRRRP